MANRIYTNTTASSLAERIAGAAKAAKALGAAPTLAQRDAALPVDDLGLSLDDDAPTSGADYPAPTDMTARRADWKAPDGKVIPMLAVGPKGAKGKFAEQKYSPAKCRALLKCFDALKTHVAWLDAHEVKPAPKPAAKSEPALTGAPVNIDPSVIVLAREIHAGGVPMGEAIALARAALA